MDETTDVSDKSQVVQVVRYIKNGKAVEKFWKFFNPADLTAATLSAIVINELELLIGSFSEKLVAQTYDGAAVLEDRTKGQKHWKIQLKDVEFLGLCQPDGTSSLER